MTIASTNDGTGSSPTGPRDAATACSHCPAGSSTACMLTVGGKLRPSCMTSTEASGSTSLASLYSSCRSIRPAASISTSEKPASKKPRRKGRSFHALRITFSTLLDEAVNRAADLLGLADLYANSMPKPQTMVVGQNTQRDEKPTVKSGNGKVGAPGFEPGAFGSQSRRATRLRYAPFCM